MTVVHRAPPARARRGVTYPENAVQSASVDDLRFRSLLMCDGQRARSEL